MKKILSVLLFVLLVIPSVLAIDIAISPAQNSHTAVDSTSCGSTVNQRFTITNNGGGGVLCWYYTNKDLTQKKLTSSCLKGTGYFDVPVPIPASGSSAVSVQLECYEFYEWWTDKCVSSYTLDEARAHDTSCSAAESNTLGCGAISLRYFDTTCIKPSITVSLSKSTLTLFNGQSESITVNVKNNGATSITCDQGLSAIGVSSSKSFTKTITAPSSGSGSKSETIDVTCSATSGSPVTESVTVTINYQTDPCVSALESARAMISDASKEINTADAKIKEANKIGSDVASATASLNQANSYYTSAQTKLSTAQSSCSSQDRTSGVSQADEAKNLALQAKTSAVTARSTSEKLIEDYNKIKIEAQNKVSDSNSGIDTANKRIGDADKKLSEAIALQDTGLIDMVQAKADVATAKSKIETANTYYKEASNLFAAGNFEGAKSKAQSAIGLADEAETLATSAYNDLDKKLSVLGECSKAILNANTEVSQMNEILTKMDYIIKNTEKWGVKLNDTKSVVITAKSNVDSSEDLLSQAKNRAASGSFSDCVDLANQARDKSAASRNRLDTMTESMSLSIQDTLEKAYADLNTKITSAEEEVQSAQNTYGATPNLNVDAQNDLSAAKSSLVQTSKDIESVKSATGLMPLLEKAEASFKSVELTQQKITSAIDNAKSAKMGLTKKIAVGAAVVAAAGGGGFLYYRSRKKRKGKVHKEMPADEQTDKDEEKLSMLKQKAKKLIESENYSEAIGCYQKVLELNSEDKEAINNIKVLTKRVNAKKSEETHLQGKKFCKSCGSKLNEHAKFCESCGEKAHN